MSDNRKIGDKSIDFSLNDQSGKTFELSEYLGKKVLLSFHPLAWTTICAMQMKALEEYKNAFTSMNTVAVGISVDSVPCKKAWADSLGIVGTLLLSDFWPHGDVARLYGIFRDKDGFSERANILIDEKGMIAFSKLYDIKQLPDIKELISVLKR